jgi:hypothetical protein
MTCSAGGCIDIQRTATPTADGGAPGPDSGGAIDALSAVDGGKETGVAVDTANDTTTDKVDDARIDAATDGFADVATADTATDAASDATADMAADAASDATADMAADAAIDIPVDVAADLANDRGTPDIPDEVDVPCTPIFTLTPAAGNGTVNLQWQSVTGVTTYQVWRATSPLGPFTSIASTNALTFLDGPGLTIGTPIYYRVSTGGGPATCENASAVMEALPCAPPTVNISAFGNTVTLIWYETFAASYTIRYGTSATSLTSSVSTTALKYTIGGLASNVPMYALVSSNNATCSVGDSTVVTATPTGCTAMPSTPILTITPDSGRNVVTWTTSVGGTGGIGYRLGFATTPGGPYTDLPNATSGYVHDGLTNGQAYYYMLKAVDSIGCASDSSLDGSIRDTQPGSLPSNAVRGLRGNVRPELGYL